MPDYLSLPGRVALFIFVLPAAIVAALAVEVAHARRDRKDS